MPRPRRSRYFLSDQYCDLYEQIVAVDSILCVWWEWIEQQRSVRSVSGSMAVRIDPFGDPAIVSMPRGTCRHERYRRAEDYNVAIMTVESQIWLNRRDNLGRLGESGWPKSWQMELTEAWCMLPYYGSDRIWRDVLDHADKNSGHWDSVRLDIYGALDKRGLV